MFICYTCLCHSEGISRNLTPTGMHNNAKMTSRNNLNYAMPSVTHGQNNDFLSLTGAFYVKTCHITQTIMALLCN